MEANWRWVALTAVAPISWGATYYVTRHVLPADLPLWGSALRALPAGLLLMALSRRLPHGRWWWRSLVLGALNVGAFFVLIYVASHLLPTSVAASIMATSPLVLAGFAWALAGERPTPRLLAGAITGIAGVLLVLGAAFHGIDARGVVASLSAMVMSSLGYVLTKRWRDGTGVLDVTAWQVTVGGLGLAVAAAVAEGPPPHLDAAGWAGAAFVSLVATALAMYCWFTGLARLSAGTVGIVGLLNPVTGVLLGTALAGERLTPVQFVGIAMVVGGLLMARRRSHRVSTAPADAHPEAVARGSEGR